MEKLTFSNMNMVNLPDELISKILDYVPMEDIFTSTQYTSSRLRRLCQEYTQPTHVDLLKYEFLKKRELCRLIKSTDIISLQYEKWFSGRHFKSRHFSTCACISRYAKSLKRFSVANYQINGNSFLFLLSSCKKIVEFKMEDSNCRSLNHAVIQLGNFSKLPFLRKLTIHDCYELKSETIIAIVRASPNLIDVSFHIERKEDMRAVITHAIRKRGAHLKRLSFCVYDHYEAIKELEYCSHLDTLEIHAIHFQDVEFKMPLLPTVKKLTLSAISLREDLSYILKSFPNLIEFTIKDYKEISMQTARCIVTWPYLRSVSIVRNLSNKMALFIFSNCKTLKLARAALPDLSEMSDNEITKCFAKLRTLHLFNVSSNAEFVAQRQANLLPQTRVYSTSNFNYLNTLRIWPEHCIFH